MPVLASPICNHSVEPTNSNQTSHRRQSSLCHLPVVIYCHRPSVPVISSQSPPMSAIVVSSIVTSQHLSLLQLHRRLVTSRPFAQSLSHRHNQERDLAPSSPVASPCSVSLLRPRHQ
ncbi:unnamed protein product [Linum trigynum]|uniref:Uncharacterized protein n=1 Tax=Linum trigynum TaxID=586398 RepID=A0AAV2EVQ5_9ROSI